MRGKRQILQNPGAAYSAEVSGVQKIRNSSLWVFFVMVGLWVIIARACIYTDGLPRKPCNHRFEQRHPVGPFYTILYPYQDTKWMIWSNTCKIRLEPSDVYDVYDPHGPSYTAEKHCEITGAATVQLPVLHGATRPSLPHGLGGLLMTSRSGGLKLSAVAGNPSVTRFTLANVKC